MSVEVKFEVAVSLPEDLASSDEKSREEAFKHLDAVLSTGTLNLSGVAWIDCRVQFRLYAAPLSIKTIQE